jgi:hypothetical protein
MVSPRESKGMPFLTGAFFVVFATLIGVMLLSIQTGHDLWVCFAYRPARATVLEKKLVKGEYFFRLHALVEYRVSEHDYQGWVELPQPSASDSGPEAEAVLGQVTIGQQVTCLHDPRDPAAGVLLDNHFEWVMVAPLSAPLIFFVVGGVGMAWSWRKTFPRGFFVETADLLGRLPRRFYKAVGGALFLVVGLIVVLLGKDVLGVVACPLFVVGIIGIIVLFRVAKASTAVAHPSPEKQAAEKQEDQAEAVAEGTAPASFWDGEAPLAVDKGEHLPVRLRGQVYPNWLGVGVLFGFPLVCFLLLGVMLLLVWLCRPWLGELPREVRTALAVTTFLGAGVIVFWATRRVVRRRRRLWVEVSAHPLQVGGHYQLALTHPDPEQLRTMQVELTCEEACDRRRAAVPVRQAIPFDERPSPTGTRLGRFAIPADAPPSLEMEHHGIHWCLTVHWEERARRKRRSFHSVRVKPAPPVEENLSGKGPAPRFEDEAVTLWIDGEQSVFRPGDTLTGGFALRPEEDDPVRTAELSVLWYTREPGTVDRGVCHFEEFTVVDGDHQSLYRDRSFRTQLPDGPFSYDGEVVKVHWAVRLRLRYVNGEEVVQEVPVRLGTAGPSQTQSDGHG